MGGAEKHVYDLVTKSDNKKFNFVIICLYDLGVFGKTLEESGIKVYHNAMRNRLDIFGVWKLNRIIRHEKADILFMVHGMPTLVWGMLCAKINKIKATLTRSPTTNPTSHVKRTKIVNFFFLRFVDKIVAQAHSHKEYQIKHGADSNKIVIINNGVDLELFSKHEDISVLRQELRIPSDAQIVGIVARLEPQKGLRFFLMAAKNIIELLPQTYFLIIGDGSERKILESMCKELSIEEKVYLVGMTKDIPRFVKLFDIGVLSSMPVGETFSNAILEYMAAAKPVVATDVGSLSEIVVDGETGYLVPSKSLEALSNALMKVLTNKELAKKMGEEGKKRVEENFTIQSMISRYEELFMSLSE